MSVEFAGVGIWSLWIATHCNSYIAIIIIFIFVIIIAKYLFTVGLDLVK